MTIFQIVGAYANAVGAHGPGSPETIAVREAHAGNPEFLGYADALDRIKLHLRGKGMGDKAPAKECRVCLKAIDPDQVRAFFRVEKYGLHPGAYWVCSWNCLEEHAAKLAKATQQRDQAWKDINEISSESVDFQAERDKLAAELAKRDETIEAQEKSLFEGVATIMALRSQLARAEAIEAKVKDLLKRVDRNEVDAIVIDQYLGNELLFLRSALASPSPAPEVAKPAGPAKAEAGQLKCPDCGSTVRLAESNEEPGRYACLRCLNDFDGPPSASTSPVIDAAARLAILERVAVAAKAVARAYNLGGMITPMGNLIDALAELGKTEATQCPIR